jgi:SAM-dependent methyltransferase
VLKRNGNKSDRPGFRFLHLWLRRVIATMEKHKESVSLAGGLSREAAVWAIRFFIGREPLSEAEIEFHQRHSSLDSLRIAFAKTAEFRHFYVKEVERQYAWAVPLFLLEPPLNEALPRKFHSPSLANPTSQLCTENQFTESLHGELCGQLGEDPSRLHRKIWEFTWIAAVLKKSGLLRKGTKGLGFGVGQEPLPVFFARHGIEVLATDAPATAIEGHGWETTGQHASSLEALRRPSLLDNNLFDTLVSFQSADMNSISDDLTGFDFCWSACCFEHLGSIDHGLDFVEQSLKTLRPGGVAIHTTEFNLSSNEETFEHPTLSLFRKRDIEALYDRLIAAGHKPWPLNFHPGTGPSDAYIDLPPYGMPHLKLEVASYVTTSIGLVIEKGSSS